MSEPVPPGAPATQPGPPQPPQPAQRGQPMPPAGGPTSWRPDGDQDELTTLWPPARLGVAAAAVLVAAVTAVLAALTSDQSGAVRIGVLHVGVTVIAALRPGAVRLQVGVGVALAASMLVGVEGTAVAVVPVVTGVVATAELLGLAGQMGTVVPRDPGPGLQRVALTTGIGALTAGATLVAGFLGGPGGLAATLLAAGGCVGFVALLRANAGSRAADTA